MGILAEGLRELLWPTRCAGCDLPGPLLCDACRQQLGLIDQAHACPRCGAPHGWLVCTECWDRELSFEAAVCGGVLEPPLSRMITLHKDASERRLAVEFGELLAPIVALTGWTPDVVCPIPASRSAVARRGFDHGEAIAAQVAMRLGVPMSPLLRRLRVRDQRKLGRIERAANVVGSFEVVLAPEDMNVLVVDDVLTTGATLGEAATVLLAGGAASVRGAAVARAW